MKVLVEMEGNTGSKTGSVYWHDGRADKVWYLHDCRADKARYSHNCPADKECLSERRFDKILVIQPIAEVYGESNGRQL